MGAVEADILVEVEGGHVLVGDPAFLAELHELRVQIERRRAGGMAEDGIRLLREQLDVLFRGKFGDVLSRIDDDFHNVVPFFYVRCMDQGVLNGVIGIF